MLVDSFGRTHTYLRISLTDACNLRCFYCMPNEDFVAMPSKDLMQADEIAIIAKTFTKLGINKIRLTGGEPLVRKDAKDIIENLAKLDVQLTLTTNGIRVHEYLNVLQTAGVKSINVSLDTLNEQKFKQITRRDSFKKTFENILLLVENGFHVKLNVVAIDKVNDEEIIDFVQLTKDLPIHVRFIEFMPFAGNNWMSGKVLPLERILSNISTQFEFVPIQTEIHDTAKVFKPLNHQGTFAIISTMTSPFCSNCNRLRLTADGKLKNCLFSGTEVDLLSALRNNQDLESLIRQHVMVKKKERGGQMNQALDQLNAEEIVNRSMISIGG